MTEQHKKKLSVAMIGIKNPFYGKKHSKEVIEIIRKANMGKKMSKETKEKIRIANIGIYMDLKRIQKNN